MINEKLAKTKKCYLILKTFMEAPSLRLVILQTLPKCYQMSPDKILLLDSLKLMVHIAKNNEICQSDISIINCITGEYLTKDLVFFLFSDADENNFSYFNKDIPLTVCILCNIENYLYQNDMSFDSSIMQTVITYFKYISELTTQSEDITSPCKNKKITDFINKLKTYISENTLSSFLDY